jgi:hypothetical protein
MANLNKNEDCFSESKGKEAKHIADVLDMFNWKNSRAWVFIANQFGTGVRHKELCSIARVLIKCFQLPGISRNEYRSCPVLIKWFEKNWESIEPILPLIQLLDVEQRPIDSVRQTKEEIPFPDEHSHPKDHLPEWRNQNKS